MIYDSSNPSDPSVLKRQAVLKAVEFVRDGMVVGLGTGSTAAFAIEALGVKIKKGLKIVGVPTSNKTARLAALVGIELTDLETHPEIDLTIDGADEVERGSLNLIKGLGGALLREKLVAAASRREIIMVEDSKVTNKLGSKAPVPVEIAQFGWNTTATRLKNLRGESFLNSGFLNPGSLNPGSQNSDSKIKLRITHDGRPFITDGGNFILDCSFGVIGDAQQLESVLCQIVGVVETGLFIDMATEVIVASSAGVSVLKHSPERL